MSLFWRKAASVAEAVRRGWSGWTGRAQRPEPLAILNMALNEVHEAIYLIDSNARFIYVNQEAVRALGYSRRELLRMSVPDIDPNFPLDLWRKIWAAVEANIPTATTAKPFETTHRTKDGRVFPVEVTSSYIRQAGQIYAMALARDISERRRAEQQRLSHVRFLESMDRVSLAIQRAGDFEEIMAGALDAALDLFDCDRAFLLLPCDPAAPAYRVPIERTRPGRPGGAVNAEIPGNADTARVLGAALAAAGPVRFGPESEHPLPAVAANLFGVKSMMAMALYPKIGAPWLFGLHQCSRVRQWTPEDEQLFDKIGGRLSDTLTSLLAHKDLQRSEAQLKEAQRIAHLGDWSLDLADGSLACSDEIYRLLELNPSEGPISSETFLQHTHPEDNEFVYNAYARSLEPGMAGDIVYRLRMKDGRIKYVNARWTTIYDAKGKPARSIGTMLDITPRKEAEALLNDQASVLELMASGATLQDSLAAVARLIEKHAVGVLSSIQKLDAQGARLKVGAAPSLPPDYLAAIDGAAADSEAGPCGTAARTGKAVYAEDIAADPQWPQHGSLALKHGLRACWAMPIFDAQRKTLGVFAIYRRQPGLPEPIHVQLLQMASHMAAIAINRHRTEAALFQAQKMEAIGQLTGGVAHDFNNLLTAIGGNLDLLRGRSPKDARTEKYARNAQMAVERAASITSQLLAFSRSQRLAPRPLDVNEVVRGMMSMLRQTVGTRIQLETRLAPETWMALADRHHLETALLNLVINARDAMPEGGVLTISASNAEIETSAEGVAPELAPGRYVALTAGDTGCGVPPELAARIFEPFVTTKEAGKGTGLGLSMVYGFARQSGGGVGFETEVGRGSSFTIYLPQTDAARAEPEAERPRQEMELHGSGVILVVEGEAQVREVAKTALSNFGYDVVEAASAAEAVEILERRSEVRLVFSDMAALRGNGADLALTIRERWPSLPVLLTAACAGPLAGSGALAGLEVLPKPYRPAELGEKVRALLAEAAKG